MTEELECDDCHGTGEVHCSATGCLQHDEDDHSIVPCESCGKSGIFGRFRKVHPDWSFVYDEALPDLPAFKRFAAQEQLAAALAELKSDFIAVFEPIVDAIAGALMKAVRLAKRMRRVR